MAEWQHMEWQVKLGPGQPPKHTGSADQSSTLIVNTYKLSTSEVALIAALRNSTTSTIPISYLPSVR